MKKFHQAQSLHNLKLPTDNEFCPCFVNNTTAASTFHLYEMATRQVNSIESFACSYGVELLSPFYEKVLTSEQFQWIKYPNKENIQVSMFYKKYGRIKICSDLINNARKAWYIVSSYHSFLAQ